MNVAPPEPRPPGEEEALARAWASPSGWRALSSVNHRPMGRRFIGTALMFFVIAGVLGLMIRAQLAVPGNQLLGPEAYNQVFTMHGTMMLFLFAVPVLQGAATWLLPLLIGARDLPFPRLGAFSYWCYLFGGCTLVSSLLIGAAPDGGWFIYPPLSGRHFSPGINIDFWLIGVTFAEIAGVAGAIEITTAILRMRAPGMTLARMPLFCWYMLATAGMILLGFPPLILGSILLELERAFGWPFFEAARGGDPVLWQHLFWLFGHPEVYIILLPAVGLLAMYVPVHARAPAFGHAWLVAAALGTGFLSMGLWVHHMYAVGIPQMSLGFFAAASTLVAIPSGIQVFALIATIGAGRPVFRPPLLFACGFLVIFVLGGLTGVMVALVPFDLVAHDTQFVVAHLHYVLIGGSVFPLLGALWHWWPAAVGRMPSARAGVWSFWLLFIGFNVNFFPLHHTGLAGMPRRVYTYPGGLGWEWSNGLASAGALLFALGVLLYLGSLLASLRRAAARPPDDPWGAGTLEWWATPPPVYNFRAIPEIEARYPLWDRPELRARIARGDGFLADPQGERRLTAVTSEVEAKPEMALDLPGPTFVPIVTAACFGTLFLGVLVKAYPVAVAGAVAAFVACLVWMWPREPDAALPATVRATATLRLPLDRGHHRAPGWTALGLTLAAEAALYASLAFAFLYLWGFAAQWPPAVAAPPLLLPLAAWAPLLLGTAAAWWGEAAIRRGDRRALARSLLLSIACGVAFLGLQLWIGLALLGPAERHARDALSHVAALWQGGHLLIAMAMLALCVLRARRGDFSAERHLAVRVGVRFWSFGVALWVVGFPLVHLAPWLFAR